MKGYSDKEIGLHTHPRPRCDHRAYGNISNRVQADALLLFNNPFIIS